MPLRPYAMVDDFSDGMRDGWESYPLAEDSGYDPSLNPVSIAGRHAIERVVVANRTGPEQIGFVRRIHLSLRGGGRIQFLYQLKGCTAGKRIRIRVFAGGTPQNIFLDVKPGSSLWQEASLPLPRLSGDLDAIAIFADLPFIEEGQRVEFRLSSVMLEGWKVPGLRLAEPQALWDAHRELYYLRSSYKEGESLTLRFLEPDVQVEMLSPKGERRFFSAQRGYVFTNEDPKGIWRLHATSSDGQADLRLLLSQKRKGQILFDRLPAVSEATLEQVRNRAAELEAKVHPELGVNIAQYDQHWLLPGLPSYFVLLEPPAELALLDSVLCRYDRDEKSCARAGVLLRSLSAWPVWVHPWFPAHGYGTYYPVGIVAGNIALARNFLSGMLSEADLQIIDRALLEKAIVPTYEEYVRTNRIPFATSNWIGNSVGGSLLAALGIDDRDTAGYILGLYEKDREHIEATYTSDGDYGEGISYLRFDLEMTSLVAAAAKRCLGVSFDDKILDAERYLYTASFGDKHVLDFGDTHADLLPVDVFAYIAATGRSPVATRFYRQYRQEKASALVPRILWDEQVNAIAETNPDENASHVFPERGVAVIRSGPEAQATVLSMRAGPNFNHNHADQGSFQLAEGGELLLGEAGYADYYKDPSYSTFHMQAVGHNVLLVDGNPQSQQWPGNRVLGSHPLFTSSLSGNAVQVVEADLSSAYGDSLNSYHRVLFFRKAKGLIVLDRMQSRQPHRYELVWHPVHASLEGGSLQPSFFLGDPDHRYAVLTLSSALLQQEVESSPLPLESYARSESGTVSHPVQVEVKTRAQHRKLDLFTLFLPDGDQRKRQEPKLLGNQEYQTLRVEDFELRTAESGVTARWRDGFLFLHQQDFSDSVRRVWSQIPVSIEAEQEGSSWRFQVQSSQPATVHLSGFGLHMQSPMLPNSSGGAAQELRVEVPLGSSTFTVTK